LAAAVEFAGQRKQSLRPGAGVMWPAGQDEHVVELGPAANVPAAQIVQTGRPSTMSLLVNPGSHKHTVPLAEEDEFAGQGAQPFAAAE
jgi:hypothetical protein